jgi:hypothetical protein
MTVKELQTLKYLLSQFTTEYYSYESNNTINILFEDIDQYIKETKIIQ